MKNTYYQKNKAILLENQKKYYQANKQKLLEYGKNYYQKHREEKIAYARNQKRDRTKKTAYDSNKLKTDINFRLAHNLRSRLFQAIKKNYKVSHTIDLLDCSLNFFKDYLEAQFKPGMSWDNYGAWHIDHIRPCASFDLSKAEEQRACFHYTNLQPLWAKENLEKRFQILEK